MNKIKAASLKAALLLILPVFLALTLKAQISSTEVLRKIDTSRGTQLTSLKTNTLAEVLQASINNGILSSTASGVNLKTTLFGLQKMFHPEVTIDTLYSKATFARNFELGFGLKINSGNAIDGVSGSLKYALINHRDLTVLSDKSFSKKARAIDHELFLADSSRVAGGNALPDAIASARDNGKLSAVERKSINDEMRTFTKEMDDTATKSKAIPDLKKFFMPFIQSRQIDLDTSFFSDLTYRGKLIDSLYNSLMDEIKKGALLTLSVTGDYASNAWDSLSFKAEYLKGLGWQKDSTKPWDLYLGAFLNLKQDTVSKQALHRQVWTGKFGLNKVLATKKDGSSFLEILGAAEYDYIQNAYAKEKSSTLVADFTITVRLSTTIFLPFELKYDPNAKNFFGYLSVKWDLLRTSAKKN